MPRKEWWAINILKRNIVIVAIICLVLFAIWFAKLGTDANNDLKFLYDYTINRNVDYNVLLKENNFYENEELSAYKCYASKGIDKYLLEFKYNLSSDKAKKIQYRYNITAQIVGTVSNNNEQGKEIWTKNYVLLDEKNADVQNNLFIVENVNINYDDYNNLARDYEDNYGISINAVLKVRFNILYDIEFDNNENKSVKDVEDYIELDIELNNSISSVEKKYEDITKKEVFPIIENDVNVYYVCSVAIIIISAILIIIIIRKKKSPEEMYKKRVNYIIKNYSELIATVSNEPNIENYNVMEITDFEDMIDLAEQNKINIIHFEKIKNKQNNFYVFIDKFVYVYILSIS